MTGCLCCFGSVGRQHIMVGVHARVKPNGLEVRKEKEGVRVFQGHPSDLRTSL
jgi:hypothetical protein